MLTPRLLLLYAAAILAKVPDSALAAPLTMAEADINAHAQGDNSATSLSTDNHAEFGTLHASDRVHAEQNGGGSAVANIASRLFWSDTLAITQGGLWHLGINLEANAGHVPKDPSFSSADYSTRLQYATSPDSEGAIQQGELFIGPDIKNALPGALTSASGPVTIDLNLQTGQAIDLQHYLNMDIAAMAALDAYSADAFIDANTQVIFSPISAGAEYIAESGTRYLTSFPVAEPDSILLFAAGLVILICPFL